MDAQEDMNMPYEWPQWKDALGNTFRVGDTLAVATISGKSPQMVICRVERINRRNSRGEPHMDRKWFEHPQPIWKTRHNGTAYEERGEYREIPSCTVTATPLVDGRKFGRYSDRKVTYTLPGNWVKVDYNAKP